MNITLIEVAENEVELAFGTVYLDSISNTGYKFLMPENSLDYEATTKLLKHIELELNKDWPDWRFSLVAENSMYIILSVTRL